MLSQFRAGLYSGRCSPFLRSRSVKILPRKWENIFLILPVLEGVTNTLLNFPRDPSSHTVPPPLPLDGTICFCLRKKCWISSFPLFAAGQCHTVSIQLWRFKETVGRGIFSGRKPCLLGCGLPRPSILALGRPLDLSLRGIQLINVELLVVSGELPWLPKRKEPLQLTNRTGSVSILCVRELFCPVWVRNKFRLQSSYTGSSRLTSTGSQSSDYSRFSPQKQCWLFVFPWQDDRLGREQGDEGSFRFITSCFLWQLYIVPPSYWTHSAQEKVSLLLCFSFIIADSPETGNICFLSPLTPTTVHFLLIITI